MSGCIGGRPRRQRDVPERSRLRRGVSWRSVIRTKTVGDMTACGAMMTGLP